MLRTALMLMLLGSLLVPVAATSTPTAAAQENQTEGNSTEAPRVAPENETVESRVDRLTVITDYRVTDDGVLRIEVYSNGGNELTVTETTEEDGATQVALTSEWVPRGRAVVTVDLTETSGWSVLITTDLSLQQERGTKLSESGGNLIGGPFDASDARDAGLGSALGVSGGALWTAWRKVSQEDEQGERVA